MTDTTNIDTTAAPKAKSKSAPKAKAAKPEKKDSPFATARRIFWTNPKQDRATFLAACAAAGMNKATAQTRFYCLTTDRDASCKDETLRGV